jgi:hypothetical protein
MENMFLVLKISLMKNTLGTLSPILVQMMKEREIENYLDEEMN